MLNSILRIFILTLVFLSTGCGRGLNTYHSAGLEQAGLVGGVLTIPSSGVAGGRCYIHMGNEGFYVNLQGSSPETIDYLNRLANREVQVSRSEVEGSLLYSVRFSGFWDEGPCPFNSAQTCSRISLTALVAY